MSFDLLGKYCDFLTNIDTKNTVENNILYKIVSN